ncbi:MAG: DNA polymerase domain-containing protein [Candidatus Thorarchaeota archaeon]|jgi:DNA polymerase elongation subunit (family B)
MRQVGWLLDASVDCENQALTLWIKANGETRGYTYREFKPSVFVSSEQMKGLDWTDTEVFSAVRTHPSVTGTKFAQKYVTVYDDKKSRVLQVFTTPDALWEVARNLERIPGMTVFHADIDPVQQFFIDRKVFPFGRVDFEVKGDIVTKIRCLDRREDSEYEIPDLEEIGFEVFVDTRQIFPKMDDKIHHIDVYHRGLTIRIEGENEREILLEFQRTIDGIDPDVIVSRGGDENLFRYLTLRAKLNGVRLVMSRDGTPLKVVHREPKSFWQYNQIVYRAGNQVMFNGRIHIDRSGSLYYSPSGMAGVVEGCRLAFAQPQRVARMSIGSVNAAVQYFNAYEMDILIPPVKRNPEFLKSVNELAAIDRGGLILQPRPDIYESIAECDFSSMYPTLMVNQNISPETICTLDDCPYNEKYCIEVPEVPFRLCKKKRGIVSKSLELVVEKRREFKKQIEKGHDTKKYRLMENTLKGVLVSCFGYLGFKNARFGRVEAHTAVTAFARDVLLKTQEIGEEMGFELIHGIVDSVWMKSEGVPEYDRIADFCRRVSDEVDITMSPKGVYRWMVIPSSRLHPSIAPLNRYYGVYANGGIKTRGIETRRRDTCLYVGDCQMAMIKTLARGRNKKEFIGRIPEAHLVCEDYIEKLYRGDVDTRDLILHTRLTREPHEYRAMSRAAIVAKQLVETGRELHAGQKVRYVMVSAESESPMRRVRALELFDDTTRYDPDAYATLCHRAFESLIPNHYLEDSNLIEKPRVLLKSASH